MEKENLVGIFHSSGLTEITKTCVFCFCRCWKFKGISICIFPKELILNKVYLQNVGIHYGTDSTRWVALHYLLAPKSRQNLKYGNTYYSLVPGDKVVLGLHSVLQFEARKISVCAKTSSVVCPAGSFIKVLVEICWDNEYATPQQYQWLPTF